VQLSDKINVYEVADTEFDELKYVMQVCIHSDFIVLVIQIFTTGFKVTSCFSNNSGTFHFY